MQTVAALTIIRDDAFFLKAWLRHYGRQIGRGNCYVVSLGAPQEQIDMAEGCSILRLPGDGAGPVEATRWRILNQLVAALACYHTHVIVGEVDELVVADPAAADSLADLLGAMPGGQILTPLGFEVIHQVAREPDPVSDIILGPRRHVRPALRFTKPCIISTPTNLLRGGRFARYAELNTPDPLYLLRLRYCDRAGSGGRDKLFEGFSGLTMQDGFDVTGLRRDMHASWERRGSTGYWQFARPDHDTQYRLPDRFAGMF